MSATIQASGATAVRCDEWLCERTHAIAEEPRDTYRARYPKAVGSWSIATKTGERVRRFCDRCGARFEAEGWVRSQSVGDEPHISGRKA